MVLQTHPTIRRHPGAGTVARMKKLLKRLALFFLAFNAVIIVTALIARKRLPTYGDAESEDFALVAAMDGVEFASRSQALRTGSGTAVAGGIEIDLTDAKPEGTATLDLRALAGGIDVVVPEDWKVELNAEVFMGGADNSATPAGGEEPDLRVNARAMMGGISVRAKRSQEMRSAPE